MEFLSEHQSFDGRVPAQQHADLAFPVLNAGTIALNSVVRLGLLSFPIPANGAPQKLELFKPGTTTPVLAQKSNNGAIHATFTVDDTELNGNWVARVTNTSPIDERVHVDATFPGTLRVQETVLDAEGLENLIDAVVNQIEVHITTSENESSITFPAGLNIPEKKFTVPDVHVGPLVEFANDINSNSISVELLNATPQNPIGALQVRVGFESAGREIKGAVGVEMSDMSLVATLGLTMFGTNLAYNTVDVDFSAEINVVGLPDNPLDPIFKSGTQSGRRLRRR